jgi:hypothetical protein
MKLNPNSLGEIIMTALKSFTPLLFSVSMLLSSQSCQAFSALISPPRIEDPAQAGKVYRNVLTIENVSNQNASYSVKTNDWALDDKGGVVFSDELASDSCRSWVGIEAKKITLGANAKTRYRFEVAVPPDAGVRECKFALMIEGDVEQVKGIQIPMSGRIGVIVYLSLNGATADLTVKSAHVQLIQGQSLPVLTIQNNGVAHGRLDGILDATDAKGQSIQLTPANDPILPHSSRDISLRPILPHNAKADTPYPELHYPLHLKGSLDTLDKTLTIDTTVGVTSKP